ncbi:MAG TPA: hypothetical protein VFC45_09020 [Pseudolabrys sp.]|nr:hypothetical protein [Pseudolabrys sp.]
MRAWFAVALIASGMAGMDPAAAADAHFGAPAVRAGQYLIYDDQPGVYVRAYWSAPWQGRHYFPFTGKRPKVGRYERLSAVRKPPKPAENFYREWSTIALYPPRAVTPPPDNTQPVIVNETSRVATPFK